MTQPRPTDVDPRAAKRRDTIYTIVAVLAFLLFIFFLVDGFNSIPVK